METVVCECFPLHLKLYLLLGGADKNDDENRDDEDED